MLLALVGPTASGKTEAGIAVAEATGAEIVSVDSMLVYRGMDIGTAKPAEQDLNRVRHHMIDVADPCEPYSVAEFQSTARRAMDEIGSRAVPVLLVGGSGLYYRSVVDDLRFPGTDLKVRRSLEGESEVLGLERLYRRLRETDPAAADKIEPANARRIIRALEVAAITGKPFSDFAKAWDLYPPDKVRAAGVRLDIEALTDRTRARVGAMLARGFLDEVSALVDSGFGSWLTSTQAIGYAEMARHLAGELTLEEAVAGTVKRTRALARRQMAWFRRDPRIHWFDAGPEGAAALTEQIIDYLRGA